MNYLILEVEGRVFSVGARLGEPDPTKLARLAQRHGYEIRTDGQPRRSLPERVAWPLTARAYTSFRADGRGRSGSSLWSYPAKTIPCARCGGEGERQYTGATCGYCRGTGRRNGFPDRSEDGNG